MAAIKMLILFVFPSICGDAASEKGKYLSETEFNGVLRSMFADYDKSIRAGGDRQLLVTLNMFVFGLSAINEAKMDYELNVFFRQTWTDSRLAYRKLTNKTINELEPINVQTEYFSKLWTPDLLFGNEKEARRHKVLTENVFLTISPDGEIMVSQRLTLVLHCDMAFEYFPFDSQICTIGLESMAHRHHQLAVGWRENDPIQINEKLALASFQLKDILIQEECNVTYTTGLFSCAQGYFVLERDVGYYVTHCFVPSFLTVLISWFGFWIKLEIAPARVTLGVATFFTISQMTQTFNAGLPKLSYIKSIDVWMITCKIFVFATILEYCIAQTVMRRGDDVGQVTRMSIGLRNGVTDWVTKKSEQGVHWLDTIAQIFFPCAFGIFNIIYWSCIYSQNEILYPDGVKSIEI